MDSTNLEKAMELYTKLITGEEVSGTGDNRGLYEDYYGNAQVYEIVSVMLKKLNLNIYEYKECLYISAGLENSVFGYRNEELKKRLGLRLNRELYLCYFVMYQVLLLFYSDSASYQFKEYIRIESIIEEVTKSLSVFSKEIAVYDLEEEKQESFKAIALAWDDMPVQTKEDIEDVRAARGSKAGIVKLVMNFLMDEHLFIEVNKRFYPTNRFHAIVEHYFEDYRGEIYNALGEENVSTESFVGEKGDIHA